MTSPSSQCLRHMMHIVAVLTPSTNSKDSLKHSPLSLFLNVEWTTPNIGCRESTVSQALSVTDAKNGDVLAVQSPKAKEQKWRLVIRKEQLEHHAVMLAMYLSCFCHSFRSKDSGSHSYNSQVLALLGWMEAMDRCVLRLAIFVLEASKLYKSFLSKEQIHRLIFFTHTHAHISTSNLSLFPFPTSFSMTMKLAGKQPFSISA